MAKTSDPGYIPGPALIPGVAAIRLIWQLPNQKIANNVLHGHYTGTPITTQTAINALMTSIGAAFTARLATSCAPTFQLNAVGYRDMADAGGGTGHGEIVSNLGAIVGTGTGDVLPPSISFVVSLKTGLAGQANRGRVYLTGFTEANNQPGGIATDTLKNACVAFMGDVNAAFTAISHPLCIAHPHRAGYTSATSGRVFPERAAGSVPVISIAALNNVWDSTRLRSLR